jgi:hypothetical protein
VFYIPVQLLTIIFILSEAMICNFTAEGLEASIAELATPYTNLSFAHANADSISLGSLLASFSATSSRYAQTSRPENMHPERQPAQIPPFVHPYPGLPPPSMLAIYRNEVFFPSAIYAGLRNNFYPGDTRIRLDYSRMVSFYDPELAPSVTRARWGKNRLEHRIRGITPEDARRVKSRVILLLMQESHAGVGADVAARGIDWQTLLHVIRDRFADRLEVLEYLLSRIPYHWSSSSVSNGHSTVVNASANATDVLEKVQWYLTVMLQPYLLQSAMDAAEPPPDLETLSSNISSLNSSSAQSTDSFTWANPIYKLCATAHTSYLPRTQLTREEKVLLKAVEGVEKEICRVLVRLFAEGHELKLLLNRTLETNVDNRYSSMDETDEDIIRVKRTMVREWKSRVKDLIAWLDWSERWRRSEAGPGCIGGCGELVIALSPSTIFPEIILFGAGNMLHARVAVFSFHDKTVCNWVWPSKARHHFLFH